MSDNLNKEERKVNDDENEYLNYKNEKGSQNDIKENIKKEKQNTNNYKENIISEVIEINESNENEQLSKSINDLFLNEEFASSVVKKKKNKIISNFHYVTFQNSFGENACFINVILHLLHFIPELNEYLISINKIYNSDKDSKAKHYLDKNTEKFLVLLGQILSKYQDIIVNKNEKYNKKNNVTIIKTLNMRKVLENISSNKFPLNSIADPIEFFSFILDILNEYLNEDLHKSFYLELTDEFFCESNKNCKISLTNKYDKDNFIYHIYIDEILKYIEENNIKVEEYQNNLFKYSYSMFLVQNSKICEKCKEKMTHNLICMNEPEFLLINCVWKESNPIVDDVITFLFLISLKDKLNNLFVSIKKHKKTQYYLLGFILYSFSLSHYIICMYNRTNHIFVLFDDEVVKEYYNLLELINDITVNKLKENKKAYFYPVMLIYTSEEIFDKKIIKSNILNHIDYSNIIKKCNEAIYEYELKNNLTEEEKLNNYQAYVEKQIELEKSIKKREKQNKKIKNSKNKKIEDIFNNNLDEINNIISKDINQKKLNNENNDKEENKAKNSNKENNIDLSDKKNENKKLKIMDKEKNDRHNCFYTYTYSNNNTYKKDKNSFFRKDKSKNDKELDEIIKNRNKKDNISENNKQININSLKNSFNKDEKYINIENNINKNKIENDCEQNYNNKIIESHIFLGKNENSKQNKKNKKNKNNKSSNNSENFNESKNIMLGKKTKK